MDGVRPSVGPLRQGQFAAFDPEPPDVDDDVEGVDEEEDEDDDDSEAGLLDDAPSPLGLLDAVSLALAALRLSVR